MSTVENMVCPDCVRPHSRDHATGCPRSIYEPPQSYVAGWKAAQRAFGDLAVSARDAERAEFAKLLRSLADEMDKRNPGPSCA